MSRYRACDPIVGRFPHAAKVIHKRLVPAGNLCVNRRINSLRAFEIGKKHGVSFHQIKQLLLIIMMPARIVDVKGHGNKIRRVKMHRA